MSLFLDWGLVMLLPVFVFLFFLMGISLISAPSKSQREFIEYIDSIRFFGGKVEIKDGTYLFIDDKEYQEECLYLIDDGNQFMIMSNSFNLMEDRLDEEMREIVTDALELCKSEMIYNEKISRSTLRVTKNLHRKNIQKRSYFFEEIKYYAREFIEDI